MCVRTIIITNVCDAKMGNKKTKQRSIYFIDILKNELPTQTPFKFRLFCRNKSECEAFPHHLKLESREGIAAEMLSTVAKDE